MSLLNKPSRNTLIIIYKLLGDLLFLLLIFFSLSLLADNIIPGIVSTHISFLKIVLLISFNLVAIYLVGNSAEIKLKKTVKSNKKTITTLTIMGILLVFNGLFRLSPYTAFFILFLSILCGLMLWRIFFEK